MKNLHKKLEEILNNHCLCNRCLGRLVAQAFHRISNEERGKIIRSFFGIEKDLGIVEIKECNLYSLPLRNEYSTKTEKCYVCNNIFEKINGIAEKIVKKIEKSGIDFSTFIVGSKLPKKIIKRDEELRNSVGVEFTESIKKELNREIGKLVEKKINKSFSSQNPDLEILVDFRRNKIILTPRSVFIVGYYKKLKRGIPQSKWILKDGTKRYRTSIQEIIEKPIIEHFRAKGIRFSAAGREDVDVRCLDWRPFVIEILKPKIRKYDLKSLENEINKSSYIKVRLLRYGERKDVVKIKQTRHDKTYHAIVVFEKEIDENKLKKIKELENTIIKQKTPTRVLHRRADLLRERKVKKIEYKILGKKKVEFIITAEAGLYIKELIHGDNGRTKPNIAELVDNKVKSILLDVIKIHKTDDL